MASIQVLNSYHHSFACELINGMNIFHNIPVTLFQRFEEDRFFNNDVRWAVSTISYLFRKDFLRIFKLLKKGLDSKETFKKYCMIITVKRNSRYFFNFLRRVSLIYEMTMYCFKKGNDYFLEARNCIAQYEDKEFFHSVGSWPRLHKTASFLRELGAPLMLVVIEERTLRSPENFTDTVGRIQSRLKSQNNTVILNSEEADFLIEQKEKFIARERDSKTESNDSKVEKEKAFIQTPESNLSMSSIASADEINIGIERQAIMDYFRSLLPPEVFNKIPKEKHTSEGTQNECSNVSKSPKPFELEKPSTDTESTVSRECDHLAIESISSLNKKLVETSHFRSDPIFHERLKEVEGKHDSFLTRSDKSNVDVNKTDNSNVLEEDLFLSESSSDDGNSQKCNIKNSAVKDNHSLLVECGLYSSDDEDLEEIDSSRKKISFPDNKPSNSKLLEEDLLHPGSSSAVGNSQQGNIKNVAVKANSSLLAECGLYLSDESSTSESPSSRKKFNSPDDKTGNSELLEDDLFASECSPEDENAQKSFMKNEPLERKKDLLAECGSGSESSSSESQSPTKEANISDNEDRCLNLLTDDLYNRAMFRRPDSFNSENVTVQQSPLKKDKHDENDSPMVKNDSHSRSGKTFVRRTIAKAESVLRNKIESTFSAVAASFSQLAALDSSREAHSENSQAASGESVKPVGETEACNKESENDSGTDVKDSHTNSQPQRRKRRKNKRKKKGRRK